MNHNIAGRTAFIVLAAFGLMVPSVRADSGGVRKAVDDWVQMWNTFDSLEVDRLFLQSEDLTYFSSERQGLIQGIEAVRAHHKGFGFAAGGNDPATRLWLDGVHIYRYHSTASVTAIWYFQRTDGSLQRGPMSVFYVKQGDEYKIAHMNFSNYETPPASDGLQAMSLLGKRLLSDPPSAASLENLAKAKQKYQNDPATIDNIIWYGRRIAYTGNYREAIRLFSEGIEKHPDEARFYRHRGHRYISVREYQAAILDFEHAWSLVEGSEDIVEPDGLPNAMNLPRSSLQTNIRYHLALAYYLTGQLEQAAEIYRTDLEGSLNDDMRVATTHWAYMTLRLLGQIQEADRILEPIDGDMNIIENQAYHELCLFYRGSISIEEIEADSPAGAMSAGAAYGVANWYSYNGHQEKAEDLLRQIVAGKSWASFGYIAAEADLKGLAP